MIKTHTLSPPGLGNFPLKHVDDYSVPQNWVKHGGVMLPMNEPPDFGEPPAFRDDDIPF